MKEAAPRFHARYKAPGQNLSLCVLRRTGEAGVRPEIRHPAGLSPGRGADAAGGGIFAGGARLRQLLRQPPDEKKSTVRLVDSITVVRQKDRIVFTFHGTGFLQNMVRILVGTLLEVGRGTRQPEDMPALLEAGTPPGRAHRPAGGPVPDESRLLTVISDRKITCCIKKSRLRAGEGADMEELLQQILQECRPYTGQGAWPPISRSWPGRTRTAWVSPCSTRTATWWRPATAAAASPSRAS